MNVDILDHHLAGGVVVVGVLGHLSIVASVNSDVRLLGIDVALDEDANVTRGTCNDESTLTGTGGFHSATSCGGRVLMRDTAEGRNGCDREVFLSWCRDILTLVLSLGVEKKDLTLVRADDKATRGVGQPCVAGVIA